MLTLLVDGLYWTTRIFVFFFFNSCVWLCLFLFFITFPHSYYLTVIWYLSQAMVLFTGPMWIVKYFKRPSTQQIVSGYQPLISLLIYSAKVLSMWDIWQMPARAGNARIENSLYTCMLVVNYLRFLWGIEDISRERDN